MCYHDLYLYLACGHAISGTDSIPNAPPCPAATREIFRRPSLASPISPNSPSNPWSNKRSRNHARSVSHVALGTCHEKMAHPLHTFRIDGLCLRCSTEREQRLARFEVGSIKAGVERDFARRRQEEHARMKRSLKMMREASLANRMAAEAMAMGSERDEGYMESIGRLMEGVKERMLAWDQSLSPVEGDKEKWVGEAAARGRH